ncbi:MAG: phosphatidylinositol transfer protein [Deltaproteobacteria bacterium]|nr:phosphatidylinositol transfer protein [Deltaproteobacteria bacterium]
MGAPLECADPPACDAEPPPAPPVVAWNDTIGSTVTVAMGPARHRGRDLFYREGEAMFAIAKFAYGPLDDDLQGEDVSVFLLRDCAGAWEPLGTVRTTQDDEMPTIEGVADTGGRVYVPLPALGPGRHRVHFVVQGDGSRADAYLQVLRDGERIVVSDVDGTLTESETAEFLTLLAGPSPADNPDAAAVMWALARRGYHLFYLTARPEWLEPRTHQWLDEERGFPPGIVHTTLDGIGAIGGAAATFKTDELAAITARLGYPPDFAFGNTDTDGQAYAAAGVDASRRYAYRFDDPSGATRIDDYGSLLASIGALPPVCR